MADAPHRCLSPWPENVWPTAEQLVAYFETACLDCRLRMAEAALTDGHRAALCRMHHDR